jgi:hypothetical protein
MQSDDRVCSGRYGRRPKMQSYPGHTAYKVDEGSCDKENKNIHVLPILLV